VTEALTDALTKLPNRRALDDELLRSYARWQRQGTSLSLMFIDIDKFKALNDTYGHAAGDAVLRGLGRVLRETARETDLVARFGGEEFCVVVANTAVSEVKLAAERLREAVAGADFRYEQTPLNVTISVGVAELMPDDDLVSLLTRSDAALYASKRAGRNCGHFHNGASCELLGKKRLATPQLTAAEPQPQERPGEPLTVSPELAEACENLRRRAEEMLSGG